MTSRYHPYRHRRPRHYAKLRLRWPRTPLDRALETQNMLDYLDYIKSQIVDAFRILEEHQRTHPSPRTATAAAILERAKHLRRT